jgi:hypothetical protein
MRWSIAAAEVLLFYLPARSVYYKLLRPVAGAPLQRDVSDYLSKTDFKIARTCATKLYYRKLGYPSTRDDDEYLQFLADGGYMVEAIAKLLYAEGIEVGFDKGPEESAAETMRLLQAHDTVTLFEATLIFGQKLVRVDILRKQGDQLELIEVKSKLIDTSEGTNPFRGGERQNHFRLAAVSGRRGVSIQCSAVPVSYHEDSALPLPS